MTNTVGIAYTSMMALIFSIFLPWWTIVIPCFFIGLLTIDKAFQSFLIGFVSILILWLVVSSFISIFTNSTLNVMVAELFQLPSPILLIIVSSLLGGVLGGFASMSGTLFKQALS